MTYGELRRRVLALIFSATLGGEDIPPEYNDQADYLAAIPGLLNAGQQLLADGPCPLEAEVPLQELTFTQGCGGRMYYLPEDFARLPPEPLRLKRPDARGLPRHSGCCRELSGGRLWVPGGECVEAVEYFRQPRSLGDCPADSAEPDNIPAAHEALAYYIAAHLVLYDDPYRYSVLWNEWEARFRRLQRPMRAEWEPVEEAYDFYSSCYA